MSWTANFIAAAEERNLGLHSLIVLQGGKTIASRWWTPHSPERVHQLYSLSKSFTATAAGLAEAEGRLALSDKVVSFFPDDLPETVSENLAAMTVHDLLCMATGHVVEPWGGGDNWAKNFLAGPVEKTPGTHFLYNSLATYMVAAIVTKITGQSLLDYLRPRLLDPLRIEKATWDSCPRGIHVGGWGLHVTTDSIAKFGELYRCDGVWNAARILPEGWVARATRAHVSNGDPAQPNDWTQGYGYQFWRCRHGAYRGDGAFGQFCVVMPEQELVVAITAGTEDMQAVLNTLWEGITPPPPVMGEPESVSLQPGAVSGSPITGGQGGNSGSRGEVPHPTGESTSPNATEKTFTFGENELGLAALTIAFDTDGATVTLNDRWGTHRFAVGLNRWRDGETTYHPAPTPTQPTAAWGAWTAPHVFSFRLCYTGYPATPLYTLTFEGDTLAFERVGSMGLGSPVKVQITSTAQ
jgi:CubicO group peptidase (beta-lactamase class C family)